MNLGGWAVERRRGPAAALHDLEWPDPPVRTAWLLDVERPALVLGSGQPDGAVDRDALAAAGFDLARRRSGGGAVLLIPGESVWVDVVVPAGDPLWCDDVRLAFHWLGEAWVAALGRLGVEAAVHRGGMVEGPWPELSRLVCFAGLGPGEVTGGARKLVGLSQRRTRRGARFQSIVHRRFDAAATVDLLAMTDGDRRRAVDRLAAGVGVVDVTTSAVEDALLGVLGDIGDLAR